MFNWFCVLFSLKCNLSLESQHFFIFMKKLLLLLWRLESLLILFSHNEFWKEFFFYVHYSPNSLLKKGNQEDINMNWSSPTVFKTCCGDLERVQITPSKLRSKTFLPVDGTGCKNIFCCNQRTVQSNWLCKSLNLLF